MQIKRIILSLSLLFSTSLIAQSISGNVKDFKTSVNLDSVKVEILSLNSGERNSVFTDQFGNWSYSFTPNSIDLGNLLSVFYVEQNYPNPFNPSTIISFQIPKKENINILIHDILGRIIDQKEFSLQRGIYSISWEGKGAAGIYFYTITTSERSITKKMLQLDGGNGRGLMDLNNSSQIGLAKRSSPDATDLELIFTKFSFVPDTLAVSVIGGEVYNSTLETIHSHAVMVDLHNDILERIFGEDPNYHLGDYHTKFETDIPRLKIGGVDIQLFVAWVNPSTYAGRYFETTVEMINRLKYEASLNSGDMIQTFDYSTSMSAIEFNKIAAVMCVEGGHSIENSIDKLITLYDAGMRYMTITWNNSLDWAISAKDSRSTTVGLNEFGREVIRKMDSLGVIIDISHTGIKTIQDILEVTNNPIIATHSGARAIQNHYRNLYDSQIIDIANSGGVIGVVFYPWFLTNSSIAYISDVIKHIDHIVNLVGIDHVSIGSDFDGTGGRLPIGLEDVTKFPDLTYALLEHGYSQSEVEKILGGNFLRVFKEVCGE